MKSRNDNATHSRKANEDSPVRSICMASNAVFTSDYLLDDKNGKPKQAA